MTADPRPLSGAGRALERKIRLSQWAMMLERLWPRLWLLVGLAGLFVLISLTGLWSTLPPLAHKALLAAFALAFIISIMLVGRIGKPDREEALRRIERRSAVRHRPATSYEDELSPASTDPASRRIWLAHKSRLERQIAGLKVGRPEPRTHRFDPIAIRAALLMLVVLAVAFVGDAARDRLSAAFRFDGGAADLASFRLDAWVTPPAYTAKAPVMLADGSLLSPRLVGDPAGRVITVPDRSQVIVRMSGAQIGKLTLEVAPVTSGAPVAIVEGQVSQAGGDVAEARHELRSSVRMRTLSDGRELAAWQFDVTPDQPPRIRLTRDPERFPRGTLKLSYAMEDDYGIASAEARFERLPDDDDEQTAWARPPKLKGPRPPHERLPVLALKMPRIGARDRAKDGELSSRHELAMHPLAGTRVRLTLVAKDHAGNIGRTEPFEMRLAERLFRRPLARAVIEQRRLLLEDPRNRQTVLRALNALTLEPAGFIEDRNVYLGLRTAFHRLKRAKTRAERKLITDQLWHLALRIEDGRGLTDAERRLRDLQERLAKALQEGASEEEIRQLMQELRQALAEFLDQLARQAQQNPMPMPDGMDQSRTLSQQDLERMLRDIEQMSRQGSRDQAQDMLSQLRDLLDMLQSGRMAQMPGQGGQQQMMQMLNQFGDIIGRQQRLLDDTFGEQRRQGGEQQGMPGQQGQQGQQRGQRGRQPGQQGQQGQGQQGQGQQGQQPGQGRGGQAQGPGELSDRQGQIREMLDRMQQGLRERGMRTPGQLGEAGEAMDNAERALRRGDLNEATREQSRALDQLRQGAQSMAQEMRQRMPGQYGQGPGSDVPRDPLGRAMNDRTNDGGSPEGDLRVPGRGEVDAQRAREILEELRRRLGEPLRPQIELDYLERLLRRF